LTNKKEAERYIGLVDVVVDSYIKHALKGRMRYLREEMMGEGYIGLMEALDKYDPNKNASKITYISVVIRWKLYHLVHAHIRKEKNERRLVDTLYKKLEEELAHTDPLPKTKEEVQEEERERYELMDRLVEEIEDPSRKEIFLSTIVDKLKTNKELAKEFNTTEAAIKMRRSRLIKSLRKQLKSEGYR
jgi:RNA polymerase sigma factor (sigma-70 family)